MKKTKNPTFTIAPAHNIDALENFIVKLTGEHLTPEDRAELEQAMAEDEGDDPDDLGEQVLDEGELVAYQDWDSGGPGGGAGRVSVYRFRDQYYIFNDVGMDGPFSDFAQAAKSSGVLVETDATVEIWITDD